MRNKVAGEVYVAIITVPDQRKGQEGKEGQQLVQGGRFVEKESGNACIPASWVTWIEKYL